MVFNESTNDIKMITYTKTLKVLEATMYSSRKTKVNVVYNNIFNNRNTVQRYASCFKNYPVFFRYQVIGTKKIIARIKMILTRLFSRTYYNICYIALLS